MKLLILPGLLLLGVPAVSFSAAGTEAASFLDIPVGAEPAALGSAYTARAENAYATIWNPAGLSRVEVPEISAMYLSYLVDTSYQQASIAIPLRMENQLPLGLGLSVQTIGSGDIQGRNETGEITSNFSSRFSAYSFGGGAALSDKLSVGTAVKVIQEKISDASASAYALDGGLLYNLSPRLTVGAAVANIGTQLKLATQSDPIPMQFRGGAAWRINPDFHLLGEGVYRRNGLFTGHLGVEYSPSLMYALRAGYQTSHTKELGFMAGATAGLGFHWKGQELAYAFVPFGELGSTHYLSIVLRLTTEPRADRAYPGLTRIRKSQAEDDDVDFQDKPASGYSDYRNLYDILNDDEKKFMKKDAPPKDKDFE